MVCCVCVWVRSLLRSWLQSEKGRPMSFEMRVSANEWILRLAVVHLTVLENHSLRITQTKIRINGELRPWLESLFTQVSGKLYCCVLDLQATELRSLLCLKRELCITVRHRRVEQLAETEERLSKIWADHQNKSRDHNSWGAKLRSSLW